MQAVKGKSSHDLVREYGRLHREFWGRHLWATGYFACTTGNVRCGHQALYREYDGSAQRMGWREDTVKARQVRLWAGRRAIPMRGLQRGSGKRDHPLGKLQYRESVGVAEVHRAGKVIRGVHQPDQRLDQVVHVTERTRLCSCSINCDGLTLERLDDETWRSSESATAFWGALQTIELRRQRTTEKPLEKRDQCGTRMVHRWLLLQHGTSHSPRKNVCRLEKPAAVVRRSARRILRLVSRECVQYFVSR